jgi:hypothetical protein
LFSLLREQPPQQQLAAGHVMRGEWVDPSAITPSAARSAPTVQGFRRACPLRWCIRRHGPERTGYSAEHLLAADRLRLLFDGARIGFSALKDRRPVSDPRMHYPQTGPSKPALRQLRCREGFERAWRLFGEDDRAMLAAVLLANTALTRYAAAVGMKPALAKQRLIEALDRLMEWFDLRPVRGVA